MTLNNTDKRKQRQYIKRQSGAKYVIKEMSLVRARRRIPLILDRGGEKATYIGGVYEENTRLGTIISHPLNWQGYGARYTLVPR